MGGKRRPADITESRALSASIELTKKPNLKCLWLFLLPFNSRTGVLDSLASARIQKDWLHRSEQVLGRGGPTMYFGPCLHWYSNKPQLVMQYMHCYTLRQVNLVWKKNSGGILDCL